MLSSYLYIYISKVKLATIVEGDPKLQHRGVGEGATPFPRLLYFTLDTYIFKSECLARRYHIPFLESLV